MIEDEALIRTVMEEGADGFIAKSPGKEQVEEDRLRRGGPGEVQDLVHRIGLPHARLRVEPLGDRMKVSGPE
jgi:hypothetical protein